MLILGSHVSLSAPDYLVGAVETALSYGANTFMFYTGAPQNTRRVPISKFKIAEAKELMKENKIELKNVIVHAPYIINLANTINESTFELAVSFLKQEIKRVAEIGVKYLILHPGSHVKAGADAGLQQVVQGLNEVFKEDNSEVVICLESMSGKGSELGRDFQELKYIVDNVEHAEKLAVCLDTCHLHDAGYDLTNFDEILAEFDQLIGLEKLKVLHLNDSKNDRGAAKDRHENIGYGKIGFATLSRIVNHPRLEKVIKILETPWYEDKPNYQKEIAMLRNNKFEEGYRENEI